MKDDHTIITYHNKTWPILKKIGIYQLVRLVKQVISDSELPSPLRLCFKTRRRANLLNETECDLHETKPEGGTDFHMNGFAMTRFDTEAKANSEMACSESSAVPLADLYFDSFSYHVAPVVSSAGGIV